MDIQYLISQSEYAALRSSSLSLDSKALHSETDIFATRARGSCGVNPGPVQLKMVTLSALSMGY